MSGWYRTGTISLINGSAIITGAGTDFIVGAAAGEGLMAPDGKTYEIASINSSTQLTLGSIYLGSTASAQPYSIIPSQSYLRDLAAQAAALVASYQTVKDTLGAGIFPDGTLASTSLQFTADPNTGLRHPSADTLAVVTGGVDRITVSNTAIAATLPITVSGVAVPTVSSADTLTNKTLTSPVLTTPLLGTPTSGDATNLTNTIAPQTHAATAKATPVDADELALADSAASFALKKLTWGNAKATLKTYLDALYSDASLFVKADASSVAFTKTAVNTAQIKAATVVNVRGTMVTFASATSITMPTLTAGTDYAIYACTDGSVRADASFSAPSGYTTANSRKIGGFHYAPGGHSGAPGGGNATAQINDYSFWDVKFKPACLDPRGMTLVAGGFWSDIYPLGVDHQANGTSKYNVTIADGASPPKVPALFGGNGTTTYTSLNQWEAAEVLAAYGKRLPTYAEFSALAYGTTEATSIGADPVTTSWNATYISKWGAAQVSGNLWCWGANFGGGAAAAGWVVNTVGRGSTYQMENAAFFGGSWGDSSNSGSRCSYWIFSPTLSSSGVGARGVCDLLVLE